MENSRADPEDPEPEYFGFIQACVNKKLGKTKNPDSLKQPILEKAIMHDLHESLGFD